MQSLYFSDDEDGDDGNSLFSVATDVSLSAGWDACEEEEEEVSTRPADLAKLLIEQEESAEGWDPVGPPLPLPTASLERFDEGSAAWSALVAIRGTRDRIDSFYNMGISHFATILDRAHGERDPIRTLCESTIDSADAQSRDFLRGAVASTVPAMEDTGEKLTKMVDAWNAAAPHAAASMIAASKHLFHAQAATWSAGLPMPSHMDNWEKTKAAVDSVSRKMRCLRMGLGGAEEAGGAPPPPSTPAAAALGPGGPHVALGDRLRGAASAAMEGIGMLDARCSRALAELEALKEKVRDGLAEITASSSAKRDEDLSEVTSNMLALTRQVFDEIDRAKGQALDALRDALTRLAPAVAELGVLAVGDLFSRMPGAVDDASSRAAVARLVELGGDGVDPLPQGGDAGV